MRAIDADAVPQEFWEYEFDGKWRGCTIKDLLDSQPTIQPEPHWIPVDLENNDPQLEEWVLVSSDGYVMQDCIVERGGEKIWYHGGNIQADDRYMPLPEPYKGVTT